MAEMKGLACNRLLGGGADGIYGVIIVGCWEVLKGVGDQEKGTLKNVKMSEALVGEGLTGLYLDSGALGQWLAPEEAEHRAPYLR